MANILPLPFRQTRPICLSDAIKRYISDKYDQHPDDFKDDLQTIDTMRDAATSVEAHASNLPKIQSYTAQIVWLCTKFPVDLGLDFVWLPALGYNTDRPVVQNNLKFELANIVFNLAALYSQLAIQCNRNAADGLKSACGYLSSAGGVISHLKTVVGDVRTRAEDMDDMTLESLERLMLAQAQECVWQKAVKDGLKDATIAKLAVQVGDFYGEARDFAIKSQGITSEWIHHMNAKHHHFLAAAQYRAACDCLEKRKYAEEIARLRDGLACVNEGMKESRYISQPVLQDLTSLKSRIQQDLKRAEKDNDTIYLENVPPKSELRSIDRVCMVGLKQPEFSTRRLFARLIPYTVHLAASIYADRRDGLVNRVIAQYEAHTAEINNTLMSCGLPGSLQAVEKPLGIPPSISSHADDVRHVGGMECIQRALKDVSRLMDLDVEILQQGIDLLQAEALEDEDTRRKYGTLKWQRISSNDAAPKLFAQVNDLHGYLAQAHKSDKLIEQKTRTNQSLIRLLSGTDRDLEDYIPSSRRPRLSPQVERDASALSALLNDLTRLEGRRKRRIDLLKAKAKTDDIKPDLLKEHDRLERLELDRSDRKDTVIVEPAQFEDLFQKRLDMYSADISQAKDTEQQELVLEKVVRVNRSFRSFETFKEREEAIQALESAYMAFNGIIRDIEGARKFYNDLSVLVGRFRDEVKTFVYQRRTEAAQVEQDLATGVHEGLTGMTSLEERRTATKQAAGLEVNMRTIHDDQRVVAPQPRHAEVKGGVWTPDMGIKFG